MYGLGGEFHYRECAACASLALADVPDDLETYYPARYYSVRTPSDSLGEGRAQSLARGLTTKAVLASTSVATVVVAATGRLGRKVPAWTTLLAGLRLAVDSAILDVGCGDGHRLRTLRAHGFHNLTGADPLLPARSTHDGITLTPQPLEELAGPFDVVMFHHSLEHLRDATATVRTARRLLRGDGAVIIRLPLAGSWAWRTYGTEWVQLDAPRHLFLPTPGGLHVLAARTGFSVARAVYDSDGFQVWGSELYRKGIPLHADEGAEPPAEAIFGTDELERFEHRAAELNAHGDGDQAAFLLRPARSTP